MAKSVFRNASVTLNGVVLSDHVESLTLQWTKADVDITAMGDGGKSHLAGIEDSQFTINFWQDWAAASVGPTLDAMLMAGTAVPFVLLPNGTAVSSTNPKYSGNCVFLSGQPLAGKVGDGMQTNATFMVNGTITMGTT